MPGVGMRFKEGEVVGGGGCYRSGMPCGVLSGTSRWVVMPVCELRCAGWPFAFWGSHTERSVLDHMLESDRYSRIYHQPVVWPHASRLHWSCPGFQVLAGLGICTPVNSRFPDCLCMGVRLLVFKLPTSSDSLLFFAVGDNTFARSPTLMVYIITPEVLQNSFLIIPSLFENSRSLGVGCAVVLAFPSPLFQALISEHLDLLGSCVREGFPKAKAPPEGDAHLGYFTFSPMFTSEALFI